MYEELISNFYVGVERDFSKAIDENSVNKIYRQARVWTWFSYHNAKMIDDWDRGCINSILRQMRDERVAEIRSGMLKVPSADGVYSISVKQEDCNCGISDFYRKVARLSKLEVNEETLYDCRHIVVSPLVADEIEAFYISEGNGADAFCYVWMMYGPKVDNNLEGYSVTFTSDFISQPEN